MGNGHCDVNDKYKEDWRVSRDFTGADSVSPLREDQYLATESGAKLNPDTGASH